MTDVHYAKEIESTLRWLHKQLREAIWEMKVDEELRLSREIARLEVLRDRYNETHDVSF